MPGDLLDSVSLTFSPLSRALFKVARPLLERPLGLTPLLETYERTQHGSGSFAGRALDALDIHVDVTGDLSSVPANGPLLVVANHPLGAIDGLAIAATLAQIRPDVRLVANRLLAAMPEMHDLCFFVDPFAGAGAASRSQAGLRAAHLWLRRGGTLVMFPAGEVAHGPLREDTHIDSPWSDTVGRLALHTGATILPVHVSGRNTPAFYAAGRLHPRLRTLLLPRELMRQSGQRVGLTIGAPLPRPTGTGERHRAAGAALAATATMRAAVEGLRDLAGRERACAAEVAALSPAARLAEAGDFAVYAAAASEIPTLLEEIGRLREVTYRAVGEGTGRAVDLDAFDQHYTHLFLWDRRAMKVAGAYRIGEADRLVAAQGVGGLYTHQLFRFDERFVRELGPALELGRSWIRPEYQKHHNALLLLWKGIGRFVVERSSARVLFGPVSISRRYSDASHALLMAFLEQHCQDRSLAALVDPRRPGQPGPIPPGTAMPATLAAADALVSTWESDGKGVPVLLRQYLKLNARLVGFNVDPDFGDALDALMVVDLTSVDRHLLARYLGAEHVEAFLARHLPGRHHSINGNRELAVA